MNDYTYPVASGVYGKTPKPTPDYTGYAQDFGGGDAILHGLRQMALSDAAAQTIGARRAGQNAAGNDPSLAAYGGLSALLSGQGNAARGINSAASGLAQQYQGQGFQERLARLYHQWQVEQQQSQNNAQLWASIFQPIGTVTGAYLGR